MKDAGRVSTVGKRRCAVTEKRVYTWAVVTPAPLPVPYVDRVPRASAIQEALF
jgi:hypothetical protein